MNTTELIIEHLITGVQSVIWMTLFACSIVGYEWLLLIPFENEIVFAIIFFTWAYPFGMLVDNLADGILAPVNRRIKSKYLDKNESIGMIRIEAQNKFVDQYFDYVRLRVRISRSTFLNLFLITIFGLVFLSVHHASLIPEGFLFKTVILFFILSGGLTSISFFTWRSISHGFYRRAASIPKQGDVDGTK